MGKLITALMFVLGGFFIYQYRYRLVSVFLNRNLFVSSVMGCPFLRDRMLQMVFPRTN
ncbi:hypothetical protein [Cytobacillus purgationiresistens]|uniref:Uncharacterized protein n=1 Tax=Cytobacillus purgationiresistens TaxID=863449 RepID=A0ABU0ADX6_9BACI|nr:hypothetical protein [Cytobacillus purgationiresistens]MDQ0269442.1 hypothetical protein [Cytobacillus purgationiresistens]